MLKRTTSYIPQSDGLVERFNRTIQQMLSAFVNKNKNDWDDHLPYLTMAYRGTTQRSTNCIPNLLMFGHELSCPIDIIAGIPPDQNDFCPSEYIEWLQNYMRDTFAFAYEQLNRATNRQKNNYDAGLKPRSFQKDNWVWRWYPPKAKEKLDLGWTGPYLVINKISSLLYKIQKNENSPEIIVHVDHLKPYEGNQTPRNWLLESVYSSEPTEIHTEIETEIDPQLQTYNSDTENIQTEVAEIPNSPSPQLPTSRFGRKIKPKQMYSP